MADNTHEQVAWNLSQVLITQIGELLKKATTEFIEGRISGAFTSMQAIRLIIHHDLDTKEELPKIISSEEKSVTMIDSGELYVGFSINQEKRKQYFLGRKNYIEYHNLIMNALKRHGYSIPPKPDTARII